MLIDVRVLTMALYQCDQTEKRLILEREPN